MLATPTPPMMSVSAPMMPKKISRPVRIFSAHLLALDRVPDAERVRVLGVEAEPRPEHLAQVHERRVHVGRLLDPEDDDVDAVVAEDRLEGRLGDDRVRGVRPAVGRGLAFALHDADDREGRVVDEDRLAERLFRAEDVLGHLVAEEDHAALLALIVRVQEAASRLREVLAGVAVVRDRADDPPVDGLLPVGDRGSPRGQLGPDRIELGHAVAGEVHVLDARLDVVPRRQPLVGLRRLAGPQDREVVAHGLLVGGHLPLQALAEGEQQEDRDGAPGQRRDRQRGPLLLQPRGQQEELQDEREGLLHSFIATTSLRPRDPGATRRAPGSSRRPGRSGRGPRP